MSALKHRLRLGRETAPPSALRRALTNWTVHSCFHYVSTWTQCLGTLHHKTYLFTVPKSCFSSCLFIWWYSSVNLTMPGTSCVVCPQNVNFDLVIVNWGWTLCVHSSWGSQDHKTFLMSMKCSLPYLSPSNVLGDFTPDGSCRDASWH